MTAPQTAHPPVDPVRLLDQAESALSEAVGSPVRLHRPERLSVDGAVWAAQLEHHSDLCSSVVIKTFHSFESDPRSTIDTVTPEQRGIGLAQEACPGLPPAILAATTELTVLEDLRILPTLNDLLMGDDPVSGEAALIAYARTLGGLHAATAGWDVEGIQSLYPGPTDVTAAWRTTVRAALDMGVAHPPTTALEDEVRSVGEALDDPGPWRAFGAGDPCPTNVLIQGESARLLDFESSGVGHCLLEAATLYFPFVWCTPWAVLPPEVAQRAQSTYRGQLATAIESAAVDRSYRSALGVAMASLTILRLARLPLIDTAQTDRARRRTQIIRTVDAFLEARKGPDSLPHLGQWLGHLRAALRARWPEGSMAPTVYPAFA